MNEGDDFSAKTLGKIILHCQNDWSGHGPAGQFRLLDSALSLWNYNSTSNSSDAPRRQSCQISANQGEAETSASVNKH